MHRRTSIAVLAAILSTTALAPAVAASPRDGDLHMAKECSEHTSGLWRWEGTYSFGPHD